MQNKPIINVIAMDCPPAIEEKFNTWYNEAHIPMSFKFKGMKRVARYQRIGDDEKLPKYLAIYNFDSLEDYEEYCKSPERAASREAGVNMN